MQWSRWIIPKAIAGQNAGREDHAVKEQEVGAMLGLSMEGQDHRLQLVVRLMQLTNCTKHDA